MPPKLVVRSSTFTKVSYKNSLETVVRNGISINFEKQNYEIKKK